MTDTAGATRHVGRRAEATSVCPKPYRFPPNAGKKHLAAVRLAKFVRPDSYDPVHVTESG